MEKMTPAAFCRSMLFLVGGSRQGGACAGRAHRRRRDASHLGEIKEKRKKAIDVTDL